MLEAVREYVARNGYPPSVREVAKRLGYRSAGSVQYHVETLIRRGLIVRTPDRARSLALARGVKTPQRAVRDRDVLIGDQPASREVVFVPVLPVGANGSTQCAQTDTMPLSAAIVGDRDVFIVRVDDDGPPGSAILQGDWVVVTPEDDPPLGVAVVVVHDEASGRSVEVRTHEHASDCEARDRTAHSTWIAGRVVAVVRRI